MGKIVVGVDASAESREAIGWALAEAGPDDSVVAVHAWDVPLVAGYEVAVAIDPTEIERGASEFLVGLTGGVGDERLSSLLAQGHAGRSIVEAGADADMIVVGHRGSGKASVVLGSTANYVLHHTERPVVVIRGDHTNKPRHVVVGVDDHGLGADDVAHEENPSVRALRFAYGLRNVGRIDVLHSWFAPGVAMGMFSNPGADMEQMDEAALQVCRHVMAAAGPTPEGVVVEPRAERGTPGFAMIEASRDADLLVIGSRGRGGFVGLLLGSTSLETAAHSHSPVAIVR